MTPRQLIWIDRIIERINDWDDVEDIRVALDRFNKGLRVEE